MPTVADVIALERAGRTAEAIRLVEALAMRGDPEALFMFGDMHWRGAGVARDFARGRMWFERASDAGHPMARRGATNLIASGIAGRRDWQGALRRLAEEARGDTRRAQMLALIEAMDLTGEGDPARLPEGEVLSEAPRITIFRSVFTPAECAFLMLVAEPCYERSLVGSANGDIPDPIRTSDGSTIHWLIEDPAIHALNRRLAALAGNRVEHGEPLQILRYRPGQEYRRHVDWLHDPNRRILTALLYLNDGYEGGETAFTRIGLSVRGHAGDVLVFRNGEASGQVDPLSEHAGMPVASGTKYLASRWMRQADHRP
jgi:prolyl 4-hydroxylase